MPYYFLRYDDTAQTGLPMGYESGLIDDDNPAPEGAQILRNQNQLDRAIDSAEKADSQLLDTIVKEDTRNDNANRNR